jgi:3-phenylpropionate/trans-cinnamate dioxygenase ferredoxin component
MMAWIDVAARADLVMPMGLEIEVAGKALLLVETEGRVHAVDAVCPHHAAWFTDGRVEGRQIFCPRHMGAFDLETGRQMAGPPCPNLGVYPVRCEKGRIQVAIGPIS